MCVQTIMHQNLKGNCVTLRKLIATIMHQDLKKSNCISCVKTQNCRMNVPLRHCVYLRASLPLGKKLV